MSLIVGFSCHEAKIVSLEVYKHQVLGDLCVEVATAHTPRKIQKQSRSLGGKAVGYLFQVQFLGSF